MVTETMSSAFAAQLETSEVNAWLDMYAAAPTDYAHDAELDILRVQEVVLTRCKTIPFIHFNCVMNLGMSTPATEKQIDQALALYREGGVQGLAFFHIPHCQPPELPAWFNARNLHVKGGWDRIYRGNQALQQNISFPDGFCVERIVQATASEWATYICQIYGLATEPWLEALVERPGWHHYALRQADRIVAVRTMYIDHYGMAWLGIDAPIPGLMAPSFDLDAQICHAMVQDGLAWGVRYFVGDVEDVSPERNTPAYRYYESLGFKHAYFRSHYCS